MTEISVQIEHDGAAIPGFPWVDERDYHLFLRRLDRITNTAIYTSAIPTLDVGVTYRVGFLLILADVSISIIVNDPGATVPFTLAAGTMFLVGGGNAAHSNTTPFVQVKPTATANILMVAGLH